MSDTNGASPATARDNTQTEMARMVFNELFSRSQLMASSLSQKRDIDNECDYPKLITTAMYREMYERNPIAARVVELMPRESWEVHPLVFETEDTEVTTAFEESWDLMVKQVRDQNSLYEDEQSTTVWQFLQKVDELSGIGQYGVLLLGIDDGKDLSQPATLYEGPGDAPVTSLTYMQAFPEYHATVDSYETNSRSPRLGQPLFYKLSLADPNSGGQIANPPAADVVVHWTRVVHIADNTKSSRVFGMPRQQQVFNNLLDLRKLYGGSAEMYWQGALPGLSLETNPELGSDVRVDDAALKDAIESYFNGLQRFLRLKHMTARSLAPQVVEPTAQIAAQIEAICIKLEVPIRIFKGSERGELASSQDDAAWNDRKRTRQKRYLSPMVIAPVIDRLIRLGVLRRPERFFIFWPDLAAQTEQEKANVAVSRTQAMSQYVGAGVARLMTELDYLTRVQGFSLKEAKAIVEARKAEPVNPLLMPTQPEKAAIAQSPTGIPNMPGETKVKVGT